MGNLWRLTTRRNNRRGLCITVRIVGQAIRNLCKIYNIHIKPVDFDTGVHHFDLLAELHNNVSTTARVIEIVMELLDL